jgi:hypothetical protein
MRKTALYGLPLLVLLTLALAIPALKTGGKHPLHAADPFDLCAYLADGPVSRIPDAPESLRQRAPGFEPGVSAACLATFDGPLAAAQEPERYVWASVLSRRMLASPGSPGNTQRYVSVFIDELRASGSVITEVEGPWRKGVIYRESGRSERGGFLADDNGVVMVFHTRGLDENLVTDLGAALARRLRGIAPAAVTPQAPATQAD